LERGGHWFLPLRRSATNDKKGREDSASSHLLRASAAEAAHEPSASSDAFRTSPIPRRHDIFGSALTWSQPVSYGHNRLRPTLTWTSPEAEIDCTDSTCDDGNGNSNSKSLWFHVFFHPPLYMIRLTYLKNLLALSRRVTEPKTQNLN